MTREELIEQLERLPAAIAAAEQAVLTAANAVRQAQESLARTQARLLLGSDAAGRPWLTGSNEAQQQAQLRQAAAPQRRLVTAAEVELARAEADLHRRRDEFSAACALARLLDSGSDATEMLCLPRALPLGRRAVAASNSR